MISTAMITLQSPTQAVSLRQGSRQCIKPYSHKVNDGLLTVSAQS
jgi:hypothetical protein